MDVSRKFLYTIAPTITLVIMIVMINYPFGVIEGWHVFLSNILLLIQTIFLYKEMGKADFSKDKKVLYTILLITILPFHYILVWGILGKENTYSA